MLCAFQEGVPEDMLTLAGYLGSVDPWYDCNINSLGAMILKLAQMVIITLLKSPQYEWNCLELNHAGSSSFDLFRILCRLCLSYVQYFNGINMWKNK